MSSTEPDFYISESAILLVPMEWTQNGYLLWRILSGHLISIRSANWLENLEVFGTLRMVLLNYDVLLPALDPAPYSSLQCLIREGIILLQRKSEVNYWDIVILSNVSIHKRVAKIEIGPSS